VQNGQNKGEGSIHGDPLFVESRAGRVLRCDGANGDGLDDEQRADGPPNIQCLPQFALIIKNSLILFDIQAALSSCIHPEKLRLGTFASCIPRQYALNSHPLRQPLHPAHAETQ
jgi:hypothetical protein